MKNKLRKEGLSARNRLTKEDIIEKSEIIKERLLNSKDYKNSEIVCIYVSFGSEVDTHLIIKEALKEKEVCVPVVQGNELILSKINDFSDLDKKNNYHILEPSSAIEVDKRLVDLMIVPGIAFDKSKHRIGYGKGFYDKLLKDFKGDKAAIAFDLQV